MILKILLRWFISLVAILAVLVTLMLTPLGLKIGLELTKLVLPGKIKYEHVSGLITGPIEISQLTYFNEKNRISIRHLKLQWDPLALIHKKIKITELNAKEVHVTIHTQKNKKTKKESKPFKPFQLDIKNAQIHSLYIGGTPKQFPIFIQHIKLDAHLTSKRVFIESFIKMKTPFPLEIRLNAVGTLDRYTIYAQALNPKITWHMYGIGNAHYLSLNLKEGKTLGGHLSFNANLRWRPQWRWDVKLNGQHLNLDRLDYNWPNNLNIQLTSKGKIYDKKPFFSLNTLITAPGTNIQLSSDKTHQLRVKWKASINKLSNIYRTIQGSLKSQGEWDLSSENPIIQGQLKLNNFSGFQYQINSINAIWMLHPKQSRLSSFRVIGKKINTPNLQITSTTLQGSGSEQSHEIQGNIVVDSSTLQFLLKGGFIHHQWKGQLRKFQIDSLQYNQWKLRKPTQLTLSKNTVSSDKLCLISNQSKGQICLHGNWDAKSAWQFKVNAQQFNPAILTRFLSRKLTLSSPSSLNASISGKGSQLDSAQIKFQLHPGNIRYQINGAYIDCPVQSGTTSITLDGKSLNSTANIIFSSKNNFKMNAKIHHFSLTKPLDHQKIEGDIKLHFYDLSPFNKVLKAIAKPSGQLTLDLSIKGKLSAPNVTGRLQLHQGSVELPRLGIVLTKIDTNISSFSTRSIKYKLTAYSKGKPIHLDGETKTTPKGLESIVTIKAKNTLVMDTAEYTIYASPDLKVTILGNNIQLEGQVDIPQGLIQPHNLTNVTTLPNDQIVYTAGEPLTKLSIWLISADIKVHLGKNVSVNTSGFSASVTGDATIIGRPTKSTLANGRIYITKGKYSAYGRTLMIAPNSYVEFIKSPANNPIFNIRATKKIDVSSTVKSQSFGLNDIIVGIELRGTFRHPKILFFSIPANLTQADIISYLVLGYASENTNMSSLSLLAEAASSLGGKGGGIGGAISEIKQGLGLTELGVESQTLIDAVGTPINQQSSFVIGKRLTKRIYIRYSLGLGQGPFTPVNIFQIRYRLNSHWVLQTDSSNLGSGGDILYTIETN